MEHSNKAHYFHNAVKFTVEGGGKGFSPLLLNRQWVSGYFPGVNRLGRHVDNLPPASVEIKNEWSYTSTSLFAFAV